MCALACSALCDEGIPPSVLSHQRGMNQNGVAKASCKGIAKDECVVQSECSLVLVAVQGASALGEIAVGNEQAALLSVDVLNDELISSVIRLVNDSITIMPSSTTCSSS